MSRPSPTRPSLDLLETRQLLSASSELPHLGGRLAGSNLVYTSDSTGAHRLDVEVPSGKAPSGGWPVVVAIHGGGWLEGDKVPYEETVAPTLLAAGFAVVAPDYTLSKPGHPSWPLNIDEVRKAVAWVRSEAARFDFDRSEIAAMGESAGAQPALMLGADPGPASTRVDSVVDFYGPTDLRALEKSDADARTAVNHLIGGTSAQFPARYLDASPVSHVSPGTPPVLIVHGTDDAVVPFDQSVELARDLTAEGVPNQLVTVEGAPHGFGLVVDGVDLRPKVVDFLDETLDR